MYSKVVVPLDGSELAEGVLPHVAEMTRDRMGLVYLLSVVPPMKGIVPAFVDVRSSSAGAQEERRRIERELQEYLQAVASRFEPAAAEVQVNVRFGRPADEILAFASEVGADLIAMSTHGRSGISRWVFGNVADKVLRGATCPVLLVRAEQPERPVVYQRILVPLDGSELAEQVLPHVKALVHLNRTSPLAESPPAFPLQGAPPASPLKGVAPTSPLKGVAPTSPLKGGQRGVMHVYLLSVLTTGLGDRTVALLTSYPPGLQLATTALHHAEIQLRAYLRSVAATLREQGAVAHVAVQQGSPADRILVYAAQVEADLIAMTTHGLSGTGRWVYGNVAGKVLQGAPCPVLLVRPTPEQGGNGL
jgi:nucleotide-binding universal stress UspA family protein